MEIITDALSAARKTVQALNQFIASTDRYINSFDTSPLALFSANETPDKTALKYHTFSVVLSDLVDLCDKNITMITTALRLSDTPEYYGYSEVLNRLFSAYLGFRGDASDFVRKSENIIKEIVSGSEANASARLILSAQRLKNSTRNTVTVISKIIKETE